jgi:hypothetical protein
MEASVAEVSFDQLEDIEDLRPVIQPRLKRFCTSHVRRQMFVESAVAHKPLTLDDRFETEIDLSGITCPSECPGTTCNVTPEVRVFGKLLIPSVVYSENCGMGY